MCEFAVGQWIPVVIRTAGTQRLSAQEKEAVWCTLGMAAGAKRALRRPNHMRETCNAEQR